MELGQPDSTEKTPSIAMHLVQVKKRRQMYAHLHLHLHGLVCPITSVRVMHLDRSTHTLGDQQVMLSNSLIRSVSAEVEVVIASKSYAEHDANAGKGEEHERQNTPHLFRLVHPAAAQRILPNLVGLDAAAPTTNR